MGIIPLLLVAAVLTVLIDRILPDFERPKGKADSNG